MSTFKTDPEQVRCMWKHYFPDIELTETKWFERYESHSLENAMRIAAENIKNGKKFDALDEKNVGRYVVAIIRNLKSGKVVKKTETGVLIKAEVSYSADYTITEKDKTRFKSFLEPSGDCLLFNGATTTGGYGKFWVDSRSINAHFFAFFADLGYLPAPNALGGVNGLQVAHNCRNRKCCNVRHLRLTTKTVNLMERVCNKTEGASIGGAGYGSTNGTLINKYIDTHCTDSNMSTSTPLNAPDSCVEPSIQDVVNEAVTATFNSNISVPAPKDDKSNGKGADISNSLYEIQKDEEGVSGQDLPAAGIGGEGIE